MDTRVDKSMIAGEDRRYRILINSITDYAICMLDQDGFVSSWNPGAEKFKGYTAEEIIGEHFSRFYTEEDRRAGKPENALAVASKENRFEQEGWRVRKDGTTFWAHVVIDPIKDSSGTVVGFAKITRDLSERKQAEEALRQSETQFKLLVQSVTDYAIYMLDRDGRVVSWNPGAQRIKGYAPEEIIGQHFSRFYTEADRQAGVPQQSLAEAARLGRFEREGWRVRKDGTHFVANVVIDAIRDAGGNVIGFAKVTRDITEQKQARQALEQAQRALHQTQKMESIGQLTGGIAHDFNNLLTAIINSLELLRKRIAGDPRALTLLQNAIDGAERGSALTQRMLAFARRQELKLEPVDVATLVSGMMGLLERSIGPAVKIDAHFPADLPPVLCDANQLESALLNLAVNARDAMPDGGTMTVTATAENIGEGRRVGVRSGRYVCLSVTDTGEGMDAQTLARATEPFFTTKGVGKGTGLGLAMVHGLAEQFGGKLTLASRPGRGTTAEIWLPLSISKSASRQIAENEATDQRGEGRRLVILAVDDDELVLASTSATLDDLGHQVIEANNGMQALELVAANASIDIVITDQAMPGMTGLQLAQAIKNLRPELPIVLATGYAELPVGVSADIYRLTKPYRRKELVEAITAASAQAPSQRRPA